LFHDGQLVDAVILLPLFPDLLCLPLSLLLQPARFFATTGSDLELQGFILGPLLSLVAVGFLHGSHLGLDGGFTLGFLLSSSVPVGFFVAGAGLLDGFSLDKFGIEVVLSKEELLQTYLGLELAGVGLLLGESLLVLFAVFCVALL
jgi:hypothetical protein